MNPSPEVLFTAAIVLLFVVWLAVNRHFTKS